LEIARKYNKSAAQILVRWGLQHGYVEIPKSSKKARIQENAKVWDFNIEDEDMQALDAMDEYLVTGSPSRRSSNSRLGPYRGRLKAMTSNLWKHWQKQN
jgi:diketogulonate reductase-like aldo/keto reductase